MVYCHESCFILLRALPALNHSTWLWFIVWFSMNWSVLPSACFNTHWTGCSGGVSTAHYTIQMSHHWPVLVLVCPVQPETHDQTVVPCHSQQHQRTLMAAFPASWDWSPHTNTALNDTVILLLMCILTVNTSKALDSDSHTPRWRGSIHVLCCSPHHHSWHLLPPPNDYASNWSQGWGR